MIELLSALVRGQTDTYSWRFQAHNVAVRATSLTSVYESQFPFLSERPNGSPAVYEYDVLLN